MTILGTVRGLSAKQIAYTITQVPFVYFHIMLLAVHSYIFTTSWKAGHNFSAQHLQECQISTLNGYEGGGYGSPYSSEFSDYIRNFFMTKIFH